MKTNTTKTLIALVVTAAVAPMSTAHASNVDVNNFLVKAHGKNFQEAVNSYDNLNQRDRMVVDGIADKTDLGGKFLDIKGVADRLAHTHTATPGWDSSKTQAFIDVANGKNGIDGAAGKDGINGVDGKDGVTTVITKVETDTATQNQVKANTAAMAKQDRTNDVQTGQIEVTNLRINEDRASIAATNARLTGDELTQMNRDRTANQHVQPVVGHDSADGVNGKDGANGKNGIDGAAGKDGINGADGKDGVTTIITKVETDTATQNQVNVNTDDLKGLQLQQANHDRTASQHVQPVVGHDGADGINGKDGANGKNGIDGTAGKDGVTTVITKVETDTATTQQVSNNAASLRAVRSEQAVQGVFVQRQTTVINQHSARLDQDSAAIAQNSQRIDQNAKRIDETKEDLKRGLNNAAAMSSLHFNGNHDSWALSTGSANGEGAALAGGLQKSLTEHTAVTFQYSDSLSGDYMVGAGIHGDW